MSTAAKYISVFFLALGALTSRAQDPHFSQYFNLPLFTNPAWCGNGINYVRMNAAYRNQWASVASPFVSQHFAIDKAVNKIGFGALVTNQTAGDAGIRQLFVAGNLSWLQSFADGKHRVALGAQMGMSQKSFDASALTFDNQYITDQGFDPSLQSGEIFSNTSISRPDLSAGMLWTMNASEESTLKPFAGISMYHITQPTETFIIDKNFLPRKTIVQAGSSIMLSETMELKPSFMMARQSKFREMVYGASLSFLLYNGHAFQIGIYNRHNDAVIAYAGYQVGKWNLGTSYDVNTSSLNNASNGIGGFEITLSYKPDKKVKKEAEKEAKKEPEKEIQKKEKPEAKKKEDPVKIIPPAAPVAAEQPKTPETKINDSDRDGLTDDKDKCPAEAGPRSNNGCPYSNIDADGDGTPDKIDDCPYIKGLPLMMGCPDSDGDGIRDLDDECPLLAGVKPAGCPDPAKPATIIITGLDNVEFETNLANISFEAIDIIREAVEMLNAASASKVMLSGHADNEGDAMHNMILSQNRADAVKEQLIKWGIDPARISTVAYGESMPIRSNSSKFGKAKNRRVEINILREKR